MKRVLAIVLSILAAPSFANNDESTISLAKAAVTKILETRYKPDECAKWKILASAGSVSQENALAKCDNDFNPGYGLDFSSVEVKRTDNFDSVCGIVSGRTELSRIGARFVYDVKSGSVTLKPSKYPMYSLASSGEFGKNQINLENKQYELVYSSKCK